MTRRKFMHEDWLQVKKMQTKHWDLGTIVFHTDWSERTLERAMKTATWRQYITLILKETETIRRKRATENWHKPQPLIDSDRLDPIRGPELLIPAVNWTSLVILISVTLLVVLAIINF